MYQTQGPFLDRPQLLQKRLPAWKRNCRRQHHVLCSCFCSMPGVHSKDAGGEPAWLAGHWRKRDVLYWAAVAAAVPVVGRALWWTAERGYNMVTPYEVNTLNILDDGFYFGEMGLHQLA